MPNTYRELEEIQFRSHVAETVMAAVILAIAIAIVGLSDTVTSATDSKPGIRIEITTS